MGSAAVAMMWYDNRTKVSLEQKIQDAASYYKKKYGRIALYCHLPLNSENVSLEEMGVKKSQYVLINHIFIGAEPLYLPEGGLNGKEKSASG